MQITALPDIARGSEMTGQEYAYRRLRHALMVGWLTPGASLTIRGLAESLDLSPTPIREALRRLSSENAIEVLGNRRLRVPDMTAGRFEELVALRETLEVHAAAQSLPHVSDLVISRMEGIDRGIRAAQAAGDLDAITGLNQDFHRTLYELPPDHAAMPLIESVWLQLGPFQRLVKEDPDTVEPADAHDAIRAALAGRDAVALDAAIRRDVRSAARRVERYHFTKVTPA